MLICTFAYIRDYCKISKILYSEDFKLVLKKYLCVDFETDWLGRLYGVMNPKIDINGKFNMNNTIMITIIALYSFKISYNNSYFYEN